MDLTPQGADFKATGSIYYSFFKENKPKSVSLVGCPLVSAVASALAKSSGKTVVLYDLKTFDQSTVSVKLRFV